MKNEKIKHLGEIVKIAARAKKKKLKIVTTNGCFDILHVGHIRNLRFAKSFGDILIVGINSDGSVRKNKGANRPIVPAQERAEILAALADVDYIFIFNDTTPIPWLKKIKPDVHIKGADRNLKQIVERGVLKKIGARLALAPYHKGKSTTALIKKIASYNLAANKR